VKGKLLSDAQLSAFARVVLLPKRRIRIRPVAFKPAEHSTETVQAHRSATQEHFTNAIESLRQRGDAKQANLAQQTRDWYLARNDSDYFWLATMSTCVGQAFFDAIVEGRDEWHDGELLGLRVAVDERIIKKRNPASIELAERTVLQLLVQEAAPEVRARVARTLVKIQAGHPFARLCFKPGEGWFFDSFLRQCCEFEARSRDTPEVRVADLVCAIFSRANRPGRSVGIAAAHDWCLLNLIGLTSSPTTMRLVLSMDGRRDYARGPRDVGE
jgi:hypothetical protein